MLVGIRVTKYNMFHFGISLNNNKYIFYFRVFSFDAQSWVSRVLHVLLTMSVTSLDTIVRNVNIVDITNASAWVW